LLDGTVKLEKSLGQFAKLVFRISPDFEKVAGENDALLLIYDTTSEDSFKYLKDYLSKAKKLNYHSTFLVGNKTDLIESRQVSTEDG
jgi:GTPase SAR1 family protein